MDSQEGFRGIHESFPFTLVRGASSTVIHDRLNPSMRRRLTDDLEALIRRAYLGAHFEAAEKLLQGLSALLASEKQQFPTGRRRSAEGVIEMLAGEIAVAKARKEAAIAQDAALSLTRQRAAVG